ncbi:MULTISPECIES: redox-sensing transcriptional repressor Rex [unclassified Halanaerobium]|uniref:redox-sensing transcriptional repressor Rex n=1 Tax=unclassified Halanaerobium TaxID=2641197 RepID=UPI000DF2C17D|nr:MULTISPECIES: redox-sensing transcriptional repressor Rex [unclassified Halanaerobium]RCW50650.1 redox-sensing transcriptional repressor [Halanaerobium sp. MA284_MarDTE_T2]RCW86818.1 redox-sensing transcriptional repressor [Halanaerobium sp. DL-01]
MGKSTEKIPEIIINRLPLYYNHLKMLQDSSKEYISSEELSELTGLSSSLIRKDLSYFGTFGRKSYGYDIDCLFQQISIIMGFNYTKKIIIVGAGYLGQALAYNRGYEERGYKLTAIFDKNPKLIDLYINNIKTQPMENLEKVIKKEKVAIAALTVPEGAAQNITDRLVAAGIKGIWNFAEIPLKVPDNVFLQEQHINQGLCKLSCFLNQEISDPREKNLKCWQE